MSGMAKVHPLGRTFRALKKTCKRGPLIGAPSNHAALKTPATNTETSVARKRTMLTFQKLGGSGGAKGSSLASVCASEDSSADIGPSVVGRGPGLNPERTPDAITPGPKRHDVKASESGSGYGGPRRAL